MPKDVRGRPQPQPRAPRRTGQPPRCRGLGAKRSITLHPARSIGDGSDIGRIKRQQAFISSLLKAIKAKGLNPTTRCCRSPSPPPSP
ncbi:hypothetical protein ACU686_10790 [Yinghuangia aomiensis]